MIKEKLCVVDVGDAAGGLAYKSAEAVAGNLAGYLEYWPARGTSKHTLMGPVAVILDTLRRENATPGSLLGRAMRAHELVRQRPMPSAALTSLEQGVRGAIDLLASKKPAERLRLITAIEWEVFYQRRKKQQERAAKRQVAWQDFLRRRYGDSIQGVQQGWGRSDVTEWGRLPSAWVDAGTPSGAYKDDVLAFREEYRQRSDTIMVDDEGETE